MAQDFKWRHFVGEIILWSVRWYCKYGISYRELEEMMEERECTWTTQRSIAGCSAMLQKSRNVCAGPGAVPDGEDAGMSTRPTLRYAADGFILPGRR